MTLDSEPPSTVLPPGVLAFLLKISIIDEAKKFGTCARWKKHELKFCAGASFVTPRSMLGLFSRPQGHSFLYGDV